jgi:hypothetical protein
MANVILLFWLITFHGLIGEEAISLSKHYSSDHLEERWSRTITFLFPLESLQESEVLKLLESCPAWTALQKDDKVSHEKIITHLKKISEFDLQVIRSSSEKYLQANPDISAKSKIFVLNRYLFNVPKKVPLNQMTGFGGWAGVPVRNSNANWMWPLSTDIFGRIKVEGVFAGYYGSKYAAIEEFDYFNRTFSRRKH